MATNQDSLQKKREEYERRKREGLCTRCLAPLTCTGFFKCEDCREEQRLLSKKELVRRRQNNLCIYCGLFPVQQDKVSCDECTEKRKVKRADLRLEGKCTVCGKPSDTYRCDPCSSPLRNWRKRLREDAFLAYGGPVCACCGETGEAFLSIDHVNNDGAFHRKNINNASIYIWLRDNNYPEGFQVLCMNCNFAKAKCGGECSHMSSTRELAQNV